MHNSHALSRKTAPAFALTAALSTAMALAGTVAAKDSPSARPSYDALPEGQSPEMLAEGRPDAIPATEHADGFHIEHPRHESYGRRGRDDSDDGRPDYASIYPSKAVADADHDGDIDALRTGQDAACLMTGNWSQEPRIEWNLSLQTYVNMTARMEDVPNSELVQPVRSELVVKKSDGTADLQIRHAWVDPQTTGARLVSSQTVPMRWVKTTMGLDIFAYRSDGNVTFVAHRRKRSRELQFVSGLSVTATDGMTSNSTAECHASVTLHIAPRIAEAAVFNTEAVLPALPKARDNGSAQGEPREFRVRPMMLALSASWTASDEAPVLSISSGWAGRERTQFF